MSPIKNMRYPVAKAAAEIERTVRASLPRNETEPPARRAAPSSKKMRLRDMTTSFWGEAGPAPTPGWAQVAWYGLLVAGRVPLGEGPIPIRSGGDPAAVGLEEG